MNMKTAVIFVVIVHCIFAHKEDLCTDLRNKLRQHCSLPETGSIVEGRRGKAGPRGPPGKVNYTLIQEKIEETYEKFEARMNEKVQQKIETCSSQIKLQEDRWQKMFNSLLTGCEKVSKNLATSWDGAGGIFNIYPDNPRQSIKVYCDEGGWTVFQRRMDGSVDFYRGWNDYVNGFGEKDKEFWLGLETIHQLTKNGRYELRVDLTDWEGNTAYAQYGTFSIAGSDNNYRLTVGDYSGNAGDSLKVRQNNQQFSTKDRDNDAWSGNCAVSWTGGWWYGMCHYSNLNGRYHMGGSGANNQNIIWRSWKGETYSIKVTEMKFRKK